MVTIFGIYLLRVGAPYALVPWRCPPEAEAIRGEPVHVEDIFAARALVPAGYVHHDAEIGDAAGLIETWQPTGDVPS